MSDLVVCSAAEAEYADALCWYAERSVSAVERFDVEFDQAIQTIASDPERFPKCDERHHYYYKMGDGDLRADHVWFLRSGSNLPGLKADEKGWRLNNAQFVVPIKFKARYLAIPKREDDFPLE